MTEETRKEKIARRNKRGVFIFFFLLFCASVYLFYRDYREKHKAEERFEELRETEDGHSEERGKSPAPHTLPKEENPDYLGWLSIENTTISYPVMQRTGVEEYYLHRDFDGNDSFYGTPFLDIRCNLESDNCIIYGHNINGGRMFGALHAFSEESYYKEHPQIELRVGEEIRNYQIVSVISTTIYSPIYSFTDTGNWQEYRENVEKILSAGSYQTEAARQIGEELAADTEEQFFRKYQFITLSTCRSWAGRNARRMVIAARVRTEEQSD